MGDYGKAREENERRRFIIFFFSPFILAPFDFLFIIIFSYRALEAKRKAMEEKKKLGGKKKASQAPTKNEFGREMGPLDMLFSSINSGNFNLKKVEN